MSEVSRVQRTLGKVRQAGVEQLLLLLGELGEGRDVLHAVGAELDGGGEVLHLVLEQGALHEGALLDAGLAVERLEQALGEDGSSVGHREGGGARTVLGLDDLVTTELDAVHELVVLLAGLDAVRLGGLRQEGHDGDTRVATDDGNIGRLGVGVGDARQEGRGAGHVERGHTEQALGVVHASLLEDLGDDRDGGVHRVRDDAEVGLGRDLGGSLGEIADDRGVRLG